MGHKDGQPCALEKSTTSGRARFVTPEEIRELSRMVSVGTQTKLVPNSDTKQRQDTNRPRGDDISRRSQAHSSKENVPLPTNRSASTSTARPRVVGDELLGRAQPATPLSTPTEEGLVLLATVSLNTELIPSQSGENVPKAAVHGPPENQKERSAKRRLPSVIMLELPSGETPILEVPSSHRRARTRRVLS